MVKGDFDEVLRKITCLCSSSTSHQCYSQEDFPEYETVTIGELKFGLCHGHQIVPWGDTESLQILQRKVLV